MKVIVDGERCQGHGRCQAIAPEVFHLDELGYSVLRFAPDAVPKGMAEVVARAAAGCPERAISLEVDQE